MFKTTRKSRLVKVAAATAAIGSIAAIGFAGNSPANADPKQYTDPIFGFGSDTTQDVINAFAGVQVGANYIAPLQTSATTGAKQIVSWDAFQAGTDPTQITCITTKVGSPQITRPNGSGNGVFALTAGFNAGAKWPVAANACGPTRSLGGIIDFARSSSGPDSGKNPVNATGPLVYVPFGRDALAFAYIRPSGSPVTSITAAQLSSIHVTGPQLVGSVPVIACGIQTASGTYSSWRRALTGSTSGTFDPGTDVCNNVGVAGSTLGRIQENNGPELLAKSTLLSSMSADACDGVIDTIAAPCTNAQLVVGFSASQWIARSNGVGTPSPGLGANGGLGAINGVSAVAGTAPNLTPVAAAYSNTTFGRDVYNVLAAEAILGVDAIPHLVDMFVGDTSKVCSATATLQQFGFLSLGTSCGSVTLRSNYRSAP